MQNEVSGNVRRKRYIFFSFFLSHWKIPLNQLCLDKQNCLTISLSSLYINSVHSFNFPSYYLPPFHTKLFFFFFSTYIFSRHLFNIIWYLQLDLASCYCKKEDVSVHMVRLKSAALRRLRKFHVFLQRHQTTKLLKNCLNCVFSLPFCENWYTAIIHLANFTRYLSCIYIYILT